MADKQIQKRSTIAGVEGMNAAAIPREQVIHALFDIGAIQFGSFQLKSGIISPIYLDLRRPISYPEVLLSIARLMWQKIDGKKFDALCGVPYGALPIGITLAVTYNKPMLMPRKEVKSHGAKRAIEGIYKQGDKVLIIEDLITSGASVIETVDLLRSEELQVDDVAVFLDREQGGAQCLAQHGLHVEAVCTMSEVLDVLLRGGKINDALYNEVKTFISNNTFGT